MHILCRRSFPPTLKRLLSLPGLLAVSLLLTMGLFPGITAAPPALAAHPPAVPTGEPDFGQVPLSFVPNAGQTDDAVHYLVRGMGGTLFFTQREVVLSLPVPDSSPAERDLATVFGPIQNPQSEIRNQLLRLRFEGANPAPDIVAGESLPGTVNYFLGNDPDQWHTNIPTYGGVVYRELYPGIDLRYDGTEGLLKGTFIVAPGVDPALIRWRYGGAADVRVDEATGDLLIDLGAGSHTLTEQAPTAWQEINGQRVPVVVGYAMADDSTGVSFSLRDYDPTRPLVIDPTLVYSTFVGGSGGSDYGYSLALDGNGNAVVTGSTSSADFPTTAGAYDTSHNGSIDVFVFRLSADGGTLVYSTFVGGSSADHGYALALDGNGNAVVTGMTDSADFPTTAGAYDTSHNSSDDGFVFKLSADGSTLLYSTFVGGSSKEYLSFGLVLDDGGDAVVTGMTESADFPTTAGAYDTSYNGSDDVFVFKLSADGSTLLYSTYVGGGSEDRHPALALDGAGNVVVTGQTASADFPTTVGAYDTSFNETYDVFVFKLSADGSALLYSTLVGGVAVTVAPPWRWTALATSWSLG